MLPYYDQDGITIYHADCREVLPMLESGSVDLVLTDPPFSVRSESWDCFDDEVDFEHFTGTWLKLAYHLSPLIVCFFGDKYVPLLRTAAARRGIPYRRGLVWRKPPGSQFGGASLDGFWWDFEMIQVFGEPRTNRSKAERFGVLDYRTVTGQEHGCEKPVGIMRELIDAYCPIDGTLLDPFMGSGTTLRAAKDLGRRAIGIEIEERYCEAAAKRLQQQVLPLAMAVS
jgi:site-specific DNA-methyltransferase (adenine-specific)